MNCRTATCWVAWLTVVPLTLATFSFAQDQDQAIGDIARQARAEKSTASHATKTLTDDDFAPQPVSEKDDPMEVVAKGARGLVADTVHRCTSQNTNNSGPGSFAETVMEFAGSDRMHMLNRQTGNNQSLTEFIVVGTSSYSRIGSDPWKKDPQDISPDTLNLFHQMPEALMIGSSTKNLRFAGRDVVGGVPTFLYEMEFHPGQVPTRDTTLKIWIGINDGLPHRFEMRNAENTYKPPIIGDETTTCSYGNVPEIKAPI